MKKIALLFLAVMLFASCKTSKKVALQALNAPFIQTRWEVQTIRGELIPEEVPSQPYILFDTLGNYKGDFGCNKFYGQFFARKNQKLKMTYTGATKRLCSDMQTERKFAEVIRYDKLSYLIRKDTMWLMSDSKEILCCKASKNN